MKPGGRLRRKTPLRSRTRLERSTPLRPVNRERRKRLHERNFGPKADWIRSLPCEVSGQRPPSDPAHTRSRGMGGCGGDSTDLVPLSREAHDDFDGRDGRTVADEDFEAKWGRTRDSVRDAAEEYERRWRDMGDRP